MPNVPPYTSRTIVKIVHFLPDDCKSRLRNLKGDRIYIDVPKIHRSGQSFRLCVKTTTIRTGRSVCTRVLSNRILEWLNEAAAIEGLS